MRVLHLLKTSEGATWAFRQMRELVKLGVEVHVLLPPDGKLIENYKQANIQLHYWHPSLVSILKTSSILRSLVKQINPDIIHSHFVLTTILMRLALRYDNVSRVFQVPGPLHLENIFFRKLDIFLSQKQDYWIGSCTWTNNCYIKSGISPKRLFLSYYGSDLEFIRPQEGTLKKTLNLHDTAFVVGMVAYMYAPKKYLGQKRGLKGHEDFIDALSLLLDKYPNLYGVCIGGAWDGAYKYERKIIDYGKRKCANRLYFLGNRSDVPSLYGDMDLVVHPSHSENLGGAAESLLLGVPTIATDIGGFPDIVKDGKTGILVPPKNPRILSQAIEKVMNNEYDLESFKQVGQQLTRKMLDVKNTANGILRIYHDIINNKSNVSE